MSTTTRPICHVLAKPLINKNEKYHPAKENPKIPPFLLQPSLPPSFSSLLLLPPPSSASKFSAMADPITDYTKTQRILLLIDLAPLLHYSPNPYITSLLSSIKPLLSFPPLSTSLFSFKLFFSSLSPLLSSSKLPFSPLSLSFDHPNNTLHSLSTSISSLLPKIEQSSFSSLSPRAIHVASMLREILHEYAWDSDSCDSFMGMSQNSDSFVIKSNLVILFSSILRSFKWVSEFFNVELNGGCLRDGNLFDEKFCGVFGSVNEGFAGKDIHFSWVDVKCEVGCVGFDESEVAFEFFEKGIKGLGWGFCSSDSIVLGSALVPFGLIYPKIGVSQKVFDFNACCKKVSLQLCLEILDVSEKPLECKCCDLELVNLDMFSRFSQKFMDSQTGSCERKKIVLEDLGGEIGKLHVKAVHMYNKGVKFEGSLSDPILIRELSGDFEEDRKENCSELFEVKVLEMLGIEMGEFVSRKSTPIWQILLSFLYREGYWALVSLSKCDGNSVTGILKPFTVSSALFFIVEDEFHPHGVAGKFDGVSLGQVVKKNEGCIPKINLSHSHGLILSRSGHSPSAKCAELGGSKKKKKKRSLNMLQELTWTVFCKAALEDFQIDLGEVYLARGCNKSKKLKFLKCWMKQIKKSSYCSWAMPDSSDPCQHITKEVHDRLNALPPESEQPVASCASMGEDSMTGASRIQDEVALDFCSETLESFFSDLPHKIQQGLESEVVDLGTLAERLVNASIYWLYQKCEKEMTSENQTTDIKSGNASATVVAIELTKLLLKEPKDLAAIYKNNEASNLSPTETTSENIVREYELQILFRMEILQSEVGASIGETTKHRFVKHICLLLETIQCHLKGGFFGDWSLDAYVGKIIKSRYSQSLGGVVHKIYEKMDLLVFSEEDELPNCVLNSEDNSQPQREETEREQMDDDNNRIKNTVSAADESLRQVETECQSPQGMNQEEHARKLVEAQARRQRARRFASFTSWVPDLQRVWAPKQPKAVKPKSDPLRKLAKRNEQRRTSYDVVLDTPMTGNKRSCNEGISSEDRNGRDYGTSLCGSVSKALFQDDDSS
ncbi:unnamed protein product [Dovyalis caffra]|uniref:Treslin n=1 Tax=Dovyalis caffra TaxID=77055 RepID=A0AAV1QQT6_9ROSI|nr:unnamed protein product [Dovyalis caffra]